MSSPNKLIENNQRWAKGALEADPAFFEKLAAGQAPEYLWIGCSDSRVPATEICGVHAGDMFVHRNVANVVTNTDLNALSVLQYAVEVLRVKHVIVCGHYGCGGVKAAMSNDKHGMIDNWLRNIKDVCAQHSEELDGIADAGARTDRMCELNVAAQVANVCQTGIVQGAWENGQPLTVHGWIFGLNDGLLKDLELTVTSADQLTEVYRLR